MSYPLLDTRIGERRLRVVASERADGDVHPERVPASTLSTRQHAVAGSHWAMADQIHGTDVLEVDHRKSSRPLRGVADVLVTADLDTRLAIWAADCAPIVLAADDGTLVGAHGGWRGLAAGVVDIAVHEARRTGASVVAAVLGPVIHSCCYEFDQSDLDTIPDAVASSTSQGAPALDVPATVAASLARHGIVLDVEGPCTGCDDRWYSHRVRADAGRHAVVAWWEPAA